MRIGYACLTVDVPGTAMKSCMMKNASEDRLYEIIEANLKALGNILDYNRLHGIKLFRISSDLIPFGSSPVNTLPWWEIFDRQLLALGEKIKAYDIRVSMHPGQYTVLNSPEEEVVGRAIKDLFYHTKVLDCLRSGTESKIVLHIGGVYGDKQSAMERFCSHYSKLDPSIKQRLIIENDDRSYNTEDVLAIGTKLGIPVVFDNLHHEANPPEQSQSEIFWINECKKTWLKKDGDQKIHYSQQEPGKKAGSHSNSIRVEEFMGFYSRLQREDLDIMLEVKDKNRSAEKCINSIALYNNPLKDCKFQ